MSIQTFIIGKIISEFGVNTLVSSVTSIISASKNIYNMLSNVNTIDNTSLNKIKELDIELTVKIIENMLDEINIEHISSNTIILALESLNTIIKQIEAELEIIDKRLKYNNSLWIFRSFRSYNFDSNAKRLLLHKKILDKRLKTFFRLINIKDELKPSKIQETTHIKQTEIIEQYI